jgi:DNA replication and repair protein RecF
LEAIFLLARGRSFRGARYGGLLTTNTQKLRLKGEIVEGEVRGALELVLGAGRKRLFDNGKRVQRVRDLKDRIRVRAVAENSQRLLDGGPAIRRLFVDWNLFHVERDYMDLYSSFRRIFDQRNAWLRKGGSGLRVWDDAYIDLSEKVSLFRERYAMELSVELERLHRHQGAFPLLRATICRGWPAEKTLGDVLSASFRQDILRGFTRFGPARADLSINVSGSPGIGSRGQAKIVVCLLQLAAQRIEQERSQRSCVWLLDDLAAELDARSSFDILEAFVGTDAQIFLSCREKGVAEESIIGMDRCRMFHVEHGEFSS